MPNTHGYMLTWTTYGTWLQGDARGFVKNGITYSGDPCLEFVNKKAQIQPSIYLNKTQRRIVQEAIIKKAQTIKHTVRAIAVQKDHIHLVLNYIHIPIYKIVAWHKTTARRALKEYGFTGKLWTKGYDKRYCFDAETLQRRIEYVEKHNQII